MDDEVAPDEEPRTPATQGPAGAVQPLAIDDAGSDESVPMPPFYMPDPVEPAGVPATAEPDPVEAGAKPAPEQDASAEAGPQASHRRRPTPIAIAIVLLVAALLFESVLLFRDNGAERDRTTILATARRFLVQLTTYDAASLDRYRQVIQSFATGKFRTDFEEITGPDFQARVRDLQASSKGTVFRLAVLGVNEDSATVTSLVDVTTSNKDLTTPRTERNVIELAMVETSNGWRIVNVELMGILVAR